MNTHDHIRRTAGFSLVELLVVLSLITLLISLTLPAFQAARQSGRSNQCIGNLHQLSISFRSYNNENDGRFPAGEYANPSGKYNKPYMYNPSDPIQSWWDWPFYLDRYVPDVRIHDCPSSPDPFPPPHNDADGNYGYNYNGLGGSASTSRKSVKHVRLPADMIQVMDNGDTYLIEGSDTRANLLEDFDLDWVKITDEKTIRHTERANVGFVDGHVETHDLDWLLDYNRGPELAPYGFRID